MIKTIVGLIAISIVILIIVIPDLEAQLEKQQQIEDGIRYYYINETDNIPYKKAVVTAFETWNEFNPDMKRKFVQTNDPDTTQVIEIIWNDEHWAFASSSTRAITLDPSYNIIRSNTPIITNGLKATFDQDCQYEHVVKHEIGHILGIIQHHTSISHLMWGIDPTEKFDDMGYNIPISDFNDCTEWK